MTETANNIYCIFDDFLVFQGRYGKSSMHSHHYLQLGISQSKAFRLLLPDWEQERGVSSFCVPPDTPHQVNLTGKTPVLMIWMDPERYSSMLSIDTEELQYPLEALEHETLSIGEQLLDCGTARKIRELVLGEPSGQAARDARIIQSIQWIQEHLTEQTITVDQLAGQVYLSKSRFMHLFSGQVGIPARKYILWQRLRHALLTLSEGSTITEAAHAAGFTDSPHMNRNFNAMFGISPSRIFKNSRFIQVFAC